ncbi:Ger(x)C family spore germination protein [Brevibacillus panacihumi]|nr:Ger(x)C family spore germination protein [Brevibacillus panacihumi]
MMLRRYLYLVVLIAMLITSGCSNAKPLNVTAIGVDKGKKGVVVHTLIAVPGKFSSIAPGGGGGSTSQNPNYILSEEGTSIADALYKMKRKSARSLNFGHTRVLLFSDELAKEGLDHFLDIFIRREEFQINLWVLTTKGSTKKILQVKPEVPESLTDYLVDALSQTGSDTMEILPIFLYEFFSYLNEPGKSPYTLEIDSQKGGNKLEFKDLVLFRKGKMVGYLNPEETKYLNLISGRRLKSTSITVKDRSYVVLTYKSKNKVSEEGIQLDFNFQIEVDETPTEATLTPAKLKELETAVADTLKKDIEGLIKKLQKLKVDPAGFGEKYRVARGGELQADEWLEDLFPAMPVQVTIKVRIERTGMLS